MESYGVRVSARETDRWDPRPCISLALTQTPQDSISLARSPGHDDYVRQSRARRTGVVFLILTGALRTTRLPGLCQLSMAEPAGWKNSVKVYSFAKSVVGSRRLEKHNRCSITGTGLIVGAGFSKGTLCAVF